MRAFLKAMANDEPGSTKAKVSRSTPCCWLQCGGVVLGVFAFHRFPVLLGTAFLAYSFGLRHAVDADHIAAIET